MSFYLSAPNVPQVKIGVYPKRHRFPGPDDDLNFSPRSAARGTAVPVVADVRDDVCYADFFRGPIAVAS